MSKVRVAVVPAAGLGVPGCQPTAVPRELLEVAGRPAIDWIFEEAASAGIEEVIVVSSIRKPMIEEFLSRSRRAPQFYSAPSHVVPRIHSVKVRVVFQNEPRGLGDAVRLGWHAAGHEPIVVMLPDELLLGGPVFLASMLKHHANTGESIVSLVRVSADEIERYGCARLVGPGPSGTMQINGFAERPLGRAPSRYALSGRYVLSTEVLSALEAIDAPLGGVLDLTTALDDVARVNGMVGLEVLPADGRIEVGTSPLSVAAVVVALETKSKHLSTAVRVHEGKRVQPSAA